MSRNNDQTSLERLQNLLNVPATSRPPEWINPLEKIEQLLTCSVCLDRYKNPKLLPCQHTFCLEPCLEGLADSLRRTIKCPECRAEHPLPLDGPKNFLTNYSLVGFLEIHFQATEDNAAEFESYIRHYNLERCKVCDEKAELTLCCHCEKKICRNCSATHFELLKRDLGRLIGHVRRVSNRVSDSIEILARNKENLKFSCNIAKDEIKDYGRYLTKELKKREDKLMSDLEYFQEAEIRSYETAKENLDFESTNLAESCDKVDQFLRGESNLTLEEMTKYKQSFNDSIDRLRAVNVDADDICNKKIIFSFGHDPHSVVQAISRFGDLQVSTSQYSKKLTLDQSLIPRLAQLNAESLHEGRLKKRSVTADVALKSLQGVSHHGQMLENRYNRSPEDSYSTSPAKSAQDFFISDASKYKKRLTDDDPQQPWRRPTSWSDQPGVVPDQTGAVGSSTTPPTWDRSVAPKIIRPKILDKKAATRGDDDDENDDDLNERIANIRRNFELIQQSRTTESENLSLEQEFTTKSRRLNQELKAIADVAASISTLAANGSSAASFETTPSEDEAQKIKNRNMINVPITLCPTQSSQSTSNDSSSTMAGPSTAHAAGVGSTDDSAQAKDSLMKKVEEPSGRIGSLSHQIASKQQQQRKIDRNRHKTVNVLQSLENESINNNNNNDESNRYNKLRRCPSTPAIDYWQKKTPSLIFGVKGADAGRMNWPRGVAYAQGTGDFLVCDSSNHRLQIFDGRGNYLKSIGVYGSEKGEFDSLAGVAVNRYGQLMVSDRYNHRIQIFDSSGKFIREFGGHGQTNGKFDNPWGLVVDSQGFIFVCDRDNHRVQIFQADGSYIGKFGGPGTNVGQFQHPTFVALNRQSQLLFVTDTDNHRVQVFDFDGSFQFAFGQEGYDEGHFKYPRGIVLDDQGFVIVADSGNNRIQVKLYPSAARVFYPDGRFLTMFGTRGSSEGQFRGPEGVIITGDGKLVIADRENHRIQVF